MDDLDYKLIQEIRRLLEHERKEEVVAAQQLLSSIKQLESAMRSQSVMHEKLMMRIENLERSLMPLVEQLKKL